MKKLLFVFFMLISVCTSAQTYFTCKLVKTSTNIDGVYVQDDSITVNLLFTIEPKKISVSDQAQSVYNIYSDGEDYKTDEYRSTIWLARDEDNASVIIESIYFKTGEFVVAIKYKDFLFEYYLEAKKDLLQ